MPRTPSPAERFQALLLHRAGPCIVWILLFQPFYAAAAPPITAAAFSAKADRVVVGSQAGIVVHSWPELRPEMRLDTALTQIHDLSFSPDGTMLLAAGGSPGETGGVECWSWPAGKRLASASPHQDVIYTVAWRGDGGACLTASEDRGLAILRLPTLETTARLPGHSRGVLTALFFDERGLVLSASRDQSLRLWDATTGKLLRNFDNHTDAVVSLALRPAQDPGLPPLVASVSLDRTLRFWQPTIGRMVRFVRLASEPLAVAWVADGSRVVVSCVDGHLRVIDPDSVQVVKDLAVLDGWAYTLVRHPESDTFLVGGRELQLKRVELSASK